MIEELKVLIELLGNVGEFSLYILAGFVIYQLVMYLSLTGSVVYILKLLITKIHDAFTREKVVKVDVGGFLFHREDWALIKEVLRNYSTSTYSRNMFHTSDVNDIVKVLKEGLKDK